MGDMNPNRGGSGVDHQVRFAVAPIRGVEFRDASANGDGSWTISGYAAVFDQETVLYDGSYQQIRESIAPTAFDDVLRSNPQVHLNFGHDMNRAVAATDVPAGQIGSLELSTDSHGLRFMARVDRNDPDAQALAVKMSRGVVRQASFAFTIDQESSVSSVTSDGRDATTYRIERVRNLYDVCCTPQGAYAQTESMLRSMGASTGQPDGGTRRVNSTQEGANIVSTDEVGDGDDVAARKRQIQKLRMKARLNVPTKETP